VGLSTHQATLDDVFLQLTGRGLEADQPGDGNGNGNAASDAARIEKVAS
jgi:hypothetical protein